MRNFLLAGLFLVVAISTANAATLSVSSDKLTYLVGETITLTVIGDDGDATAHGVQGRLDYSGALVDNGTRTQITLSGSFGNWITGTLPGSDNGIAAWSLAFNQITPTLDQQDTALNLPGALSTVTLIAAAVGVVNVNWHTVQDGFQLDFFGVTNAPGTSFTIVPEPATAVLLALGLLALSATRPGRVS
jgi:hypothetical protein